MTKQKWSKKNLHYLDVHLTISSVDTAILHVGVNDSLEDNSQSKIENLMTDRGTKMSHLLN